MHQSVSSTKSEFDGLVARMLSNWPLRDPGIAAGKKSELRRVYERVGIDRFRAGVDAAIDGHHGGFFPAADEFQAFIPERSITAKSAERCGICENTGGLVLEFQDQPNGSRRAVMVKCLHGQEIHHYDDYQERRVGQ